MKLKILLILFLVILGFGLGFYFKDNILRVYSSFNSKLQKIDITDVGSIINQVSRELSLPPPLYVYKETDAVTLLKSKIIEETNFHRWENGGLNSLTENKKLNDVALAKANDMFLNQYFDHVSPIGVGPGDLAQQYGYEYITVGENLILGNFLSEEELVQEWMNSPGHRANILNNRYTEMGVAVIKGTYKGRLVWIGVQEFGLPLSSCDQPSSILKTQIDLNNSKLNFLEGQLEEYKTRIENEDKKSSTYRQMVKSYNELVKEYNSLVEKTKSIVAEYNRQVNNFNNCVTSTK